MSKKIGNLFATAYLLILVAVYPFYMKNGYVEIGKAKFEFWACISISAALLMFFFLVLRLVKERAIYTMDIWVLLFGVCIAISYLVSIDRKEAFLGTDGWNMGVLVYGLLCLLYFMITRLWNPGYYIFGVSLVAAGIVFVLGLLDRFSIYLIPLSIRDSGFVSTLGNINWFCGYLVIFLSLGAGLFVLGRKHEILLGGFCLVGFMAGFSQGGSSVFLYFIALFAGLLWIAAERREWLLKWSVLAGIWCVSAQAVRWMRFFLSGYNYETNNLCGYFTGGNTTWYFLLVVVVLFLIFLRISSQGVLPVKRIRTTIGIAAGFAVVFYLIMGFYSTYLNRGLLENGHFLVWEDAWGNGRGVTFRTGILLFKNMDVPNKLFGVGADCFSTYAYSIPEIAEILQNYFAGSRLTNAHNELITMLVNFGVLGTISYYGIYISYFHGMLRRERNPYILSVGVAAFCYLIHNLVSFATILNLPFLIVLLAMGQKCSIITYYDQIK